MKSFISKYKVQLIIMCIVLVAVILTTRESDNRNKEVFNLCQELAEQAYIKGQADALIGDVRITANDDGTCCKLKKPITE